MKKFQCPYCNCDLTKEGIILEEIGSVVRLIKYNSKGLYESNDKINGQTDEYIASCGNCAKALDIELGDIWDTLPEIIDKSERIIN